MNQMKKNHYEAPVSRMTRVAAEDVMTRTLIGVVNNDKVYETHIPDNDIPKNRN